MKTSHLISKTCAAMASAVLLMTWPAPSQVVGETNPSQKAVVVVTNTTAGVPSSEGGTNAAIVKHSGSDNVLGLPKDTLDRLPPDQIVELLRMKQSHPGDIVPIVAMAVPIALFAAMVFVVALVVSMRLKKNRMLHETLRAMIEKGAPIPPELLNPPNPRRPKSDLRNGLVWIGVGVGLTLMFLAQGHNNWPVGLIPLLIGVAFLITWKLETKKNGDPK
jgi:hypothetical protein